DLVELLGSNAGTTVADGYFHHIARLLYIDIDRQTNRAVRISVGQQVGEDMRQDVCRAISRRHGGLHAQTNVSWSAHGNKGRNDVREFPLYQGWLSGPKALGISASQDQQVLNHVTEPFCLRLQIRQKLVLLLLFQYLGTDTQESRSSEYRRS